MHKDTTKKETINVSTYVTTSSHIYSGSTTGQKDFAMHDKRGQTKFHNEF